MNRLPVLLLGAFASLFASAALLADNNASLPTQADVVVYGGTPAGVMAAVAAARQGHTVILVDINSHVGGMVSSGLSYTDMGNRRTVGGLASEFFDRIQKYYRDTYGPLSTQFARCRKGGMFEPHIAEKTFNDMIQEQQPRITVWKHCRFKSASLAGTSVAELVTNCLDDNTERSFTGKIFIDASYEGDLMAGVHVPYRIGREGRDEYGESLAGISVGPKKGQADGLVMDYNYRLCLTATPENRIPFPMPGNYDREHWDKLFGSRLKNGTVTEFGKMLWFDPVGAVGPNDKYDENSQDMDDQSSAYPDGDWATRDKIAAAQRDYILSKHYYLQNDSELPQSWRDDVQKWGFAKDEFTDNGGFPFQLYIREGRRMVGAYVLRQNDLSQDRYKPDGVCSGSYGVDCHAIQYLLINGQRVEDATPHLADNAYDIPYASLTPKDHPDNLLVPVCLSATHVAYCSVRMEPVYMMLGHAAGDAAHLALLNKTSVQNVDTRQLRHLLLNEKAVLDSGYLPPVKISFSPRHPQPGETVHFHAEAGALKYPLKNLWWDLDGTGDIAAQGADANHSFKLEKIYHTSLVVEDASGRRRIAFADVPVGAAEPLDVTVDDTDAKKTGRWDMGYPLLPGHPEFYSDVFLDAGLSFDTMVHGKKLPATALFQPVLTRAGRYLVCFGYRPVLNQEKNLTVTVSNQGQVTTRTIDEETKASPFPFVSLGDFHCEAGADSSLTIDNANTEGRVAVDAVRWVWEGN